MFNLYDNPVRRWRDPELPMILKLKLELSNDNRPVVLSQTWTPGLQGTRRELPATLCCHHLPRELGAAVVPRTQALGADPTSEALWACERQRGPSSRKPAQIPVSRAGITTISCRERIWDFPGCCKLDSDFAPGAKFSVNHKFEESC